MCKMLIRNALTQNSTRKDMRVESYFPQAFCVNRQPVITRAPGMATWSHVGQDDPDCLGCVDEKPRKMALT
jgi:hypothetical protein